MIFDRLITGGLIGLLLYLSLLFTPLFFFGDIFVRIKHLKVISFQLFFFDYIVIFYPKHVYL